jgi:hypothetical protein
MVFTKVLNSESRTKAHIFFHRFGMVVHQPQATPVIVSVQYFCSMVIGFFVVSCGNHSIGWSVWRPSFSFFLSEQCLFFSPLTRKLFHLGGYLIAIVERSLELYFKCATPFSSNIKVLL